MSRANSSATALVAVTRVATHCEGKHAEVPTALSVLFKERQVIELSEDVLKAIHGGDAAATRTSNQNAWGETTSSNLNAGACKSDITAGAGMGATAGASLGMAFGGAGAAIGGMVGLLGGGALAASSSSACKP